VHPTTRALATLGLLLATTIGCSKFTGGDKPAAMQGKVAIIDLDSIARQIGYDSQMNTAVEQQKASLAKQLGVIQAGFNEEITKKQSEFGATPTQEQSQQLRQQRLAATAKLQQQDRQAGMLLGQYKAQLVQQFRNAVKPAARAVAADKGLSIILTKNDGVVFDYDTAVDITDAVVERMRAEQPSAPVRAESQENRDPTQTPPADDRAANNGRP
jgi:Skp family chaperone for outer membrane proteins